jgi:hypothetical protein
MMATSFATNVYRERKRVGGISRAGSNFATGATRPRPRTAPRIGGPAAEHASGPINYLEPDPLGLDTANYRYAVNSPLAFDDPTGLDIAVDYAGGVPGVPAISSVSVDDWGKGCGCGGPTGIQTFYFRPGTAGYLLGLIPIGLPWTRGSVTNLPWGGAGGMNPTSPQFGGSDYYCTTCEQDKRAMAALFALQASPPRNSGGASTLINTALQAAGIGPSQRCSQLGGAIPPPLPTPTP